MLCANICLLNRQTFVVACLPTRDKPCNRGSSMKLSHEVLSESKSVRELTISERSDQNALDMLNKAKALVMAVWQETGRATTEQIAEYYEVAIDTVKSCLRNNKEEFEKEVENVTGEELKELRSTLNLCSNVHTVNLWTARGALRVGLMLTKSTVAKNVRDVVINVVEYAQPKLKTQAEYLLESVQLLVEIERRQLALEADNQALKAKTEHLDEKVEAQEKWLEGIDAELDRLESPDGHYFSVIGYGNLNKVVIGHQLSISLGKKCSAYCRKNGLRKEFVTDSMYGRVGIYPPECLEFVFVSEGLLSSR